MHGGSSPGAPKGKANGNYRNGRFTCEAIAERRQAIGVDQRDGAAREVRGMSRVGASIGRAVGGLMKIALPLGIALLVASVPQVASAQALVTSCAGSRGHAYFLEPKNDGWTEDE
jgi:hypothetical protein